MKSIWLLLGVLPVAVAASWLPAAEVVSLEYFIDTDPGFGNGIALEMDPADEVSAQAVGALDGLDAGMHMLYVRAGDSNGVPSMLAAQPFVVAIDPASPITITQVAYSVDSGSPGGEAQLLPVSADEQVSLDAHIPLAGMDDGMRVLTVRAVDDRGRPGIPASCLVAKTSSILEPPPLLDWLRYWIVPEAGGSPLLDQVIPVGDTWTLSQGIEDALAGLTRGDTYRLILQAADVEGGLGNPVQAGFRFVCLGDLWAEQFFSEEDLQDPLISGPDADPNANGIPNRVEAALATDPLSVDPALVMNQPTMDGQEFQLSGHSWQGGIGTPLLDYEINGYHVWTEAATDLLAQDWGLASEILEATVEPSADRFFTDEVTLRMTDDAAAASQTYFFRVIVQWPTSCTPFALFEKPAP